MNFNTQPTLENDLIILQPLQPEHFDRLFEVAADPLIWEQHPAKERSTRAGFELFFNEAIATKSAFLVIDKKSGAAIGSTRYFPVAGIPNAVEIGWTFLAREYWGTDYNPSMKRLMLDYAFQFVDNVLFMIHETNYRSQKAVEKIGGKRVTELDHVPILDHTPIETRSAATVVYVIHKS
jgi:RimJ/RimL family protein N-acetyltransferase